MLDGAGLFDRASMHLLLAKDGYDALSLCRHRAVDLVILQQTMGAVSGLSVCRTIKHADQPPPVILILDQSDAPERRAAERAGADAVLVLPLEPDVIVHSAAVVLGIAAREDVRVLTRLRCQASGAEKELIMGTATDISASGMCVETNAALRQGDIVNAEFFLPGSSEACAAACQVMRVDPHADGVSCGLRFTDLNPALSRRLRAFVNARQRP
jgi:DNA-binding response OmpR family regulator